MHIEIIGSTSAGKTTLAKSMVFAGNNNGEIVTLSDDFILQESHLGLVKNDFLRRRLVEMLAIGISLFHINEYKELFRFILIEGNSSPGSWFYKFNRIRNVIRKIGIFEFISKRSSGHQVVLADNEGLLQGAHNLFVHQNGGSDTAKIARYVDLVPLPDVVLYLNQDEDVLVSRTLKRGHARIAGVSEENVTHFINQAITVFNQLVSIPKVQGKLLIVDGGMNISKNNDEIFSDDFNRIAKLLQ